MKKIAKRVVPLSICTALFLGVNIHAEEQTVRLDEVSVMSESSSEVTEGTDSYTTKSMNTATRMNMSIKETPQSIVVVTNQQIQDQGLETITDVVNSITGITAKTFDSERQGYSARGFDITNYQIDGVATSWTAGWSGGETSQDLTIYDRVEVLRGANGLISGAGNPSAAINLIRKHANSKEFVGSLKLDGGTWNKYGGTLDIQTPLTQNGKVRARIAGTYQKKESFVDYYENKKTVLYGIVDMDITDATLLSIGASYQKNDPTASMWGGLPSWYSDGTKTNWDRKTTTAPKWSYWGSETNTYFTTLEHYFLNDIKFYASLSHSENTADAKLFYMYGTPDKNTGIGLGGSAGWYDVNREQDNIDIYTSIPFSFNGLKQEIVAGLMYNEQDLETYSKAGVGLSPIGNFYNWDGSYNEPTWGNKSLSQQGTTKQTGVYLVGRFSILDDLKLILGSRLTNWEIDMFSNGTNYGYKHDDIITPYAGLVYDLDKNHSVYVSYTDIFNPQDNQDKNGKFLDPIEGKNYETGIKGEYFDGKLNTSLSIFRIEQDNLAQNDPSGAFVPGTTTLASVAAEGTVSKGYEIDINGQITDNWDMSFGWSQFEAKDVNNDKVNTRHPRKTAKIYTRYKFDKLSIGGGINWESKTFTNVTNPVTSKEEKLSQDAYSIVNMMMKYELSKVLTAQLNINNIFDKTYYSNVGFYNQLAYGDSRNMTVSLKYNF